MATWFPWRTRHSRWHCGAGQEGGVWSGHQDSASETFPTNDWRPESWTESHPCAQSLHVHACVLSSFSCVRLCVTLWTVACRALLSMWFSRKEYWNGLPDPGIEPRSLTPPVLAGRFFTTSTTWKPNPSTMLCNSGIQRTSQKNSVESPWVNETRFPPGLEFGLNPVT